MKKHIPNLITLGNLFCGIIATIYAVEKAFDMAALFVVLGILLDFFDGFAARLLGVSGELGKQLDSLADVVTSGVVPGIIMFQLLALNTFEGSFEEIETITEYGLQFAPIQFLGLLLTLGACYRLAKFNIDTRQTDSFIGLPTPAMSLFIISLPLIKMQTDLYFVEILLQNKYVLICITLCLTFVMNAEIPLFSLKFKEYSIKNNWIKYIFLLASILLIVTTKYASIPLIIILYIVLSVIANSKSKETAKLS
ncbi:CDP-alcohol phosphatidyltransferase family protein [uncultured Polaribacter sp.]|uniref:CDP-alcohol phosphatidyltransferase family protein n=1 Tax=uncultured Polaribacter sp. TaxID=174711 RepID=UPI002603A4EF|nr:CDP-alcohol phosphatidyltransferase family protein [uncultured Polaribacter sp.]